MPSMFPLPCREKSLRARRAMRRGRYGLVAPLLLVCLLACPPAALAQDAATSDDAAWGHTQLWIVAPTRFAPDASSQQVREKVSVRGAGESGLAHTGDDTSEHAPLLVAIAAELLVLIGCATRTYDPLAQP